MLPSHVDYLKTKCRWQVTAKRAYTRDPAKSEWADYAVKVVREAMMETSLHATLITSSSPAWTSSAGMLSIPADFPFFNGCTAASTSLRRMGWPSSVSVWGQSSTDGSSLAL